MQEIRRTSEALEFDNGHLCIARESTVIDSDPLPLARPAIFLPHGFTHLRHQHYSSDIFAAVRLQNVLLVSVYIPPGLAPDKYQGALDKLSSFLVHVRSAFDLPYVILAGDWQTTLGEQAFEPHIGPHGEASVCNTFLFRAFVLQHDFRVPHSWQPHEPSHAYLGSRRGLYASRTLDWILVSPSFDAINFTPTMEKVAEEIKVSDHLLLLLMPPSTITLHKPRRRRFKAPVSKQQRGSDLWQQQAVAMHTLDLANVHTLSDMKSVILEALQKTHEQAALALDFLELPGLSSYVQTVWTLQTHGMSFLSPANLFQALHPNDAPTPQRCADAVRITRRLAKRFSKSELTQDLRFMYIKISAKLRRYLKVLLARSTPTPFHEVIKQFRRHQPQARHVYQELEGSHGELLEPQAWPDALRQYFTDTYSDPDSTDALLALPPSPPAEITQDHVMSAIWRLRTSASIGPDLIPPTALKNLSYNSKSHVARLFTDHLNHNPRHQPWRIVLARFMPKPGKPTLFKGRLIAQLEITHKLYLSTIHAAMLDSLSHALHPSVYGFLAAQRPQHLQLHSNAFFQQADLWGIPLIVAIADLSRAFASIKHIAAWHALRRHGMPEAWATAIIRDAADTCLHLHTNTDSLGIFPLQRGFIEGAAHSAMILSVCLSTIMMDIEHTCPTELWYAQLPGDLHQRPLPHPPAGWVDDWIFMANTREHLEAILNAFATAAQRHGLTLALDKFQCTSNAHSNANAFIHRDTTHRRSDTINFIGAILQPDGQSQAMVEARIAAAHSKWHATTKRASFRRIQLPLLRRLHNTYLLPSLTWSLDAFALTQRQHIQLRTAANLALRRFVPRRPLLSPLQQALLHQSTIHRWRHTGAIPSHIPRIVSSRVQLYTTLPQRFADVMQYRDAQWDLQWGRAKGKPRRATVGHRHVLWKERPLPGESLVELLVRETRRLGSAAR